MSPSAGGPDRERSWCERAAAARRRGDHLAVVDIATAGLAEIPDALALHHAAILALARTGATREARERFDRLAEAGRLDTIADPGLGLDFAALDGRLHKDAWAHASGETAKGHASRSAAAYEAAFARFGHPYPAVNAATMSLAAGRLGDAARLARAALALAGDSMADYWSAATVAEAAMLLGDHAAARAGLAHAARATAAGLDDIAATRRQLALAARLAGANPALIEALPAPQVLYWLDDGAGPSASRDGVELGGGPAVVFGPVVDAADVERALRILERGLELNLVLPCGAEAWLDALSPADATATAPRLAVALQGAANVLVVTPEGGAREPAALHLCRLQVQGLAVLRATSFVTSARRLHWTGRPAGQPSVETGGASAGEEAGASPSEGGRTPRAIVFADIRGYSRLPETSQLVVVDGLMDAFADVLTACGGVDHATTAGDGLHVVLSDVAAATQCCFGLRAAASPEVVAGLGLPPHLGLRIGAHVGPVYRRFDRVTRRYNFHGSEIIRAARIEPVTPVGEIFVTEQFAATLAATSPPDVACDYVGRQAMAKGFGECRMYAMRRRPARADPDGSGFR